MSERGRGDERIPTTILFTDIVDSTIRAGELGDEKWREILRSHHATIRRELKRYGGHEVDNAGDGFFAAFSSPAAAIRCACAVVDAVKPLGIEVRAGVHVGESLRIGDKPGGMAVHIGSRIAGNAGPSEVAVSGTVRDLTTGSGIAFEDRGMTALKGVEGDWRIYAVARKGELAPRALVPERPPTERRGGRPRWAIPAALAVVAALIVAGIGITRRDEGGAVGGGPSPSALPSGELGPPFGNGVYVIDPQTNSIIEGNSTVAPANPLLPYGDSVWVGSESLIGLYSAPLDEYVTRYPVTSTFGRPPSFAFARGSVWALIHPIGTANELYRLDPEGHGERPDPVETLDGLSGLVHTRGEFYTASQDRILRLNAQTGEVTDAVAIPGVKPVQLIAQGPILYALDPISAAIERIDLRTGTHRPLPIPNVLAMAFGDGRLWLTTSDGSLLGLDPGSLLPEVTNPAIGPRAFAVAVGPDSLWIGSREGKVLRVPLDEPEAEPVVIDLGIRVESIALAVTPRVVWLGVGCVSSGFGSCPDTGN